MTQSSLNEIDKKSNFIHIKKATHWWNDSASVSRISAVLTIPVHLRVGGRSTHYVADDCLLYAFLLSGELNDINIVTLMKKHEPNQIIFTFNRIVPLSG